MAAAPVVESVKASKSGLRNPAPATDSSQIAVSKEALMTIIDSPQYANHAPNRTMSELLGLSNQETIESKRIISDAVKRFRELESARKRIINDDNGSEWIEVPTLGEEGAEFAASLAAQLTQQLGDVGDVIFAAVNESRTFSGFGDRARRFSLEEEEVDGQIRRDLAGGYYSEDGTPESVWKQHFDEQGSKELRENYGHLFFDANE
ncbi:MAG: hypothetical protein KDN22_31150 [Verrucomicrobiae bacterium]|nr:hypothetical protein [Verrucomicrobiae bacterium]